MLDLTYVLLYVDNPPASAAFYTELLGRQPVESSPTFALFVFPSGTKLGLWSRRTVEPSAAATDSNPGDHSEIGFPVADATTVDAIHAEWRERGLTILQEPTDLDFGHTFVALDPDGNRLRVFALALDPK